MLTLAALFLGTLAGALVMAMLASGAAEDAYQRGRRDERASALARALWEADHLIPERSHIRKADTHHDDH